MRHLTIQDFINEAKEDIQYSGFTGSVVASMKNWWNSTVGGIKYFPEWLSSKKFFTMKETPEFFTLHGEHYLRLVEEAKTKDQCVNLIEELDCEIDSVAYFKKLISKYKPGFRYDGEVGDVASAAAGGAAAGALVASVHGGTGADVRSAAMDNGVNSAANALVFGLIGLLVRYYSDAYFRENIELYDRYGAPLISKAKKNAEVKFHTLTEYVHQSGPVNFFE